MSNSIIIFGSTTGNTESVAEKIKSQIGDCEMVNADSADVNNLVSYKNIILGTSTWGVGDLQDDWEDFLPKLKEVDLSGKNVAIFGLGDAEAYADSFVDGIGTIYEALKDSGCKFIGQCDTDEYDFADSTAVINDEFIGLPLDEDNESDKTDERIKNWVDSFKGEL